MPRWPQAREGRWEIDHSLSVDPPPSRVFVAGQAPLGREPFNPQTADARAQGPRQIRLELVLANHELEAAISIMRGAWWS
jgi:hypothetical protein